MRSGPWLAVLVVASLLGGCLSSGQRDGHDEAPSARLAPDEWRALLTEPIYDQIESTVHYLEAEDGTQLSLKLHLPAGLPAEARIPTLLQLTPYQAFLSVPTDGPVVGTSGAGASWAFYVQRGAAYVEADARGTAASGGCLDFGGSLDRSDAVVFADWIRSRPWSNDVVVTDGVSHPGMGSVVAHAADGRLTAALAHAPVVSYYQDEWLRGARFEDQFNGAAYQAVELGAPVYLDPRAATAQVAPCTGETAAAFNAPEGTFTPFWDDKHLARHNEAALGSNAPILLTHGFVDLNVHPDHAQLYWDALPADHPKHLVMGWWYHGWPDMEGHPFESFGDIRHRWLDATLHGRDNGLWAEPRVLVEDSTGTWHESHDWPLDGSERVVLQTSGGDGLARGGAATAGEAVFTDRLGAERGRWTEAHVAFRTEPLTNGTLVNGAPTVRLVASSSEAETKWVVYLLDEAPDGSWQRISHGYVDSHQWDGEDQWKSMTPGTAYAWDVALMPTAVVVQAGHRITLLVASQDSRQAGDPDPNVQPYCFDDHRGGCYRPSGILPAATAGRATNAVLTGSEGTSVSLHLVDPSTTAKPPWPV